MHQGTALVTGASAGLGAAFAEALAARGHALILTARRGDRLEALAADLRARHAVTVDTIAADLATPGAADALLHEIGARRLAVNLLVNNAGFGLQGPFVEMDHAALARMVELNCRAAMELCQLVLPGMIQMRSGAILNVASVAAFQPGPWLASYAATKAFLLSLSQALHSEVRRHGVRVTALCPGPIATEFGTVSGLDRSRWFRAAAMRPEPVVAAGLKALDRGAAVRVVGLGNKLMVSAGRVLPRGWTRRVASFVQRPPARAG